MEESIKNISPCWLHLFDKHKELISDIFNTSLEYQLPIYPPYHLIFKVFEMDVNDIKIVFLGQDCYHGPNQAMGLSFSVNNDVKIPPSLANIYKELKNTYPERNYVFENGNLEKWFTREKIFLLNCALTVLEGKPAIFMKKWQPFTEDVIKFINDNNKKCLFLLLGNFAKEKLKLIDDESRTILGVHPSPLSAHKGFLGSKIFKKLDEKLGYDVDWTI